MRSLLINAGLLLGSTCACFLFAETGLRVRQWDKGIPLFQTASEFADPELGWSGRFVEGGPDGGGKILFLGDSFTDGLGVPDEKLYFSVAARSLDAGFAAYGGKGYGTLQELLALRRLLPQVEPRLIVLQLCANDFLNNSWELERRSYLQNALLPRPYLIDGDIRLLYPRRFPHLRLALDERSRLFHLLFMKSEIFLNDLARQKKLGSIEHEIVGAHGRLPAFRDAVETTRTIVRRFVAEAKGVPIVAFEADEIPPYHDAFAEVMRDSGIPLFSGVSSAIMDAEKARMKMRQSDTVHWNEAGHRLAGTALAEWLRTTGPS